MVDEKMDIVCTMSEKIAEGVNAALLRCDRVRQLVITELDRKLALIKQQVKKPAFTFTKYGEKKPSLKPQVVKQ